MDDEFVSIAEGARRLGDVSDKTIRRAIWSGKLTARRPQKNKSEISMADLRAWHSSRMLRPGQTEDRLAALEARVGQLESELQALRKELESSLAKRKAPPKPSEEAPAGFTYLSDFCAQHYIPYDAAEELFPRAIHGQKIKVRGRLQPIIGSRGRHDFWVQLHNRLDLGFRSCDDCPHHIPEDS